MTVKKAAPLSSQLDGGRGIVEGSQVPVVPTPADPPTRDGDEKKSRRSSHRKA